MSPDALSEVCQIARKYGAKRAIAAAEHDIVYFGISLEDVPENSADGEKLKKLGCHVEDDSWCDYV